MERFPDALRHAAEARCICRSTCLLNKMTSPCESCDCRVISMNSNTGENKSGGQNHSLFCATLKQGNSIWVLVMVWPNWFEQKGTPNQKCWLWRRVETLFIPKARAIVEWVIFHARATETKVGGMDNSDAHARLDVAKGGSLLAKAVLVQSVKSPKSHAPKRSRINTGYTTS